ncbi:LuxR family transcriptional regulator [Erythrobacter sp. KY5]|uniref:helix-turn-helix domain-containing protein n=1 Tax=Erythrobacter sp. KY5 TaxID=2011159 RepID=UPI000DBF3172|nr:DUF4019 domain-containing protein [Erythrobacter sp. KY5]AWW74927.1 LuxR family transcriptional regulator [Erythrobacter sp. KY5]
MDRSVADLTEKEREALHLLLDGHDTKSSATALGLSVHTVNDRLRNARRKLGVSSSREAARILRDAEGQTPQNPVHTSLGMERETVADENAVLSQTRRIGPSRAVWLSGGMLTMSIIIALAVFTSVSPSETSSNVASAPEYPVEEGARVTPEDPESLNLANAFLDKVDSSDWAGSWNTAGAMFRNEVTSAEWESQVKPVRLPLGAVNARRLVNVQRASTLPGAPEGEYEVLQFQTDFAGKEGMSIETVVMVMGKNGWEVSGYFIV